MRQARKRLVIVDQSLRGFDGHHFEYDLAVAKAARTAGLNVTVLAHRDFASALSFPVPVKSWFWETSDDARRGRLARALFDVIAPLPPVMQRAATDLASHARRLADRLHFDPGSPSRTFGERLAAGLAEEQLGPDDHVLIHSFLDVELRALLNAVVTMGTLPHIHIVLRRDADETADSEGLNDTLLALSAPHLAGRVHLYADTRPLADQYDAVVGSGRFKVLPVPHCLEGVLPGRRQVEEALRMVYLGNARLEKGFERLPNLVRTLHADYFQTGRVRLIAQANIPMSLEQGETARAARSLAQYPRSEVEVIGRDLSVSEFQALLYSADLVLLPYRADLYRRRSSGILVQAAVAGKPTVIPDGSWLASEAPEGSFVRFGDGVGFPEAVRRAVETYPQLARAAAAAAPFMREHHSPERLVEILTATD